jgi:hypothetical protein
MDRASLQLGAWAVAIHLWFLPVYLGVVAATPAMHAAHRRWGMVVPAVLAIAAAGTNALALLGIPLIGWANYALVWGAVHQVGFAWQDKTLARHKLLLPAMVAGGVIALVGLVYVGPFQLSMLAGAVGAGIPNTSPPSVALLAYAATQSGLLIAIAPALTRWVRQPRRWRTVSKVNRLVMTIYLWHMAPVVIVALLLYPAGWWPQSRFGSTGWWQWRVAWVAVLTVVFVPLIVAVGRVERAVAGYPFWAEGRAHSLRGRLLLAAGITSTAGGLCWFTVGGFAPDGHRAGSRRLHDGDPVDLHEPTGRSRVMTATTVGVHKDTAPGNGVCYALPGRSTSPGHGETTCRPRHIRPCTIGATPTTPCLAVVRPDACALANNHLLDFGYQGSADTLDALSGAGLRAVGRAATKTKRNDPQSPPSRAVAGR